VGQAESYQLHTGRTGARWLARTTRSFVLLVVLPRTKRLWSIYLPLDVLTLSLRRQLMLKNESGL
jgi:hypothetical protein